ncbi:MAG: HlyD family type I secretion periplasmic adaptor subunit, partial [Gammaproteobacteria bacterium]
RTEAESTYGIVASNYNAQQALQARLMAERDHAAEILFPAGLGKDQDSPEIKDLKDTQARVFTARKEALNGSVQILEQQIPPAQR